ncbi:neutrophil cytosol factor 2-like isoform X1 [Salvelinus fontinalis]|uniref:neutrophil cytosol factor 2-like isoform X1 n=1 Tax=Salvelinus fontinalis TaxID=8038 RepID=UPI0024864572|nr:neutrophil cytosol factor 2-like isoform X1 [Salvelinus fontinalis]
MTFVNTLKQWDEAVACFERGDSAAALGTFLDIQEKNSKIFFNIGCLHLINKNLDAAEKALDSCIGKDEHLAVAFFQRGLTFYKKERFEESFADFQHAFKELRGNQLIDYKPLGLRYKLYACEVLHNMALAHAQLGQWEKAKENLLTALNLRTEAKLSHIDRGLECILKQKLFEPVKVPAKVLFKPNKNYVAELEKKDYLGKAKVVSSIIFQDEFSGFAPLQPQVEDVPTRPKAPEVMRALEGEPHTVLFEFVPETSDELAVVPGNIVFVLNKGSDNWASVIFNERRGLVPYNFLERLEITLSSKQDQDGTDKDDIPAPPRREPPNRPQRNSAASATENQSIGDTKTESCQSEEFSDHSLCVVKVHFTYTIAICMVPGLPYTTTLEKISNKLGLPATAITLSYAQIDSGKKVIDENTRMEDVWSCVHNGRLTLWCDLKEGMSEQLQSQTHLMALHSYESSTPEDLEFHQGDTILLLSKVNEDWFEGQCNGKSGIFPASFVEEVPMKDK